MAGITGVAHFSIPVSDPERSTRFYTDVVGCKLLRAHPDQGMTFLDAGGVAVLLIKTPYAPTTAISNTVHHAFTLPTGDYQAGLAHLRAKGVKIELEEDRRRGTINGPRAYFYDPDGTVLEYIDRTSYMR
jgi:catechol 2,3-dioxygenase-like lactoylglutathione lyase family enzyme